MKNSIKQSQTASTVARIGYASALGMALLCAAPHRALAQTVTPPPVPAEIRVPEEHQAFFFGRGIGTQNYICAPGKSIGQVAWTLFTPEATLFGDQGEQLTTHFFSPNPEEGRTVRAAWQDSRDTSTVWGKVVASSNDANFVAPGAISWLLVEVVGTQAGPTGGTALIGTTFIQRVNTKEGVAPSTGCDKPSDLGAKAFISYEADYFFFKKP